MNKKMGLCIVVLVIALLGATGYISYDIGHSEGYSSGYYSGKQVFVDECTNLLEQQEIKYKAHISCVKSDYESEFNEVFRQGVYEGYCICAGYSEYVEFDPQTDGVCYAFRQESIFPCTNQLTDFWVSYVDNNTRHSHRVEYCQPCDFGR